MKLKVTVKPNSKNESVEFSEDVCTVRVNSPPVDGKANKRVTELLAKHYGVAKSKISLISGHKSKIKIFSIDI
ncbi:MAG: DUF167 domain-containing protein [Bdellovibrionales bacterium]